MASIDQLLVDERSEGEINNSRVDVSVQGVDPLQNFNVLNKNNKKRTECVWSRKKN